MKDEHGDEEEESISTKLPLVCKILILLELPYYFGNCIQEDMVGHMGAEKTGDPEWSHHINIHALIAACIGIFAALVADAVTGRFSMFLSLLCLSLLSPILCILLIAFEWRQAEDLYYYAFLWAELTTVAEPIRMAFVFDQVPITTAEHSRKEFFLLFQEIKTVAKLAFTLVFKLSFLEGNELAKENTLASNYLVQYLFYAAVLALMKNKWVLEKTTIKTVTTMLRAYTYAGRRKITNWSKSWWELAAVKYDRSVIIVAKALLSIIFIYATMICYGIYYYLVVTVWKDQSIHCVEIPSHKAIYSDYKAVYYALTFIFLPIIVYGILPVIDKCLKRELSDLQQIGASIFLCGAGFLATAIFQVILERTTTLLPQSGFGQVRFYNTAYGTATVKTEWGRVPAVLKTGDVLTAIKIDSIGSTVHDTSVSINTTTWHIIITVTELQSTSYVITDSGIIMMETFDPFSVRYKDAIMFIINPGIDQHINILLNDQTYASPTIGHITNYTLPPGDYVVNCSKDCRHTNFHFKVGGIYSVIVINGTVRVYTVVREASMSIYNMVPQIVILAFGIACGKIPINVFLYKEAPHALRATTIALYLALNKCGPVLLDFIRSHTDLSSSSYLLMIITCVYYSFFVFYLYATYKHSSEFLRLHRDIVLEARSKKNTQVFSRHKFAAIAAQANQGY